MSLSWSNKEMIFKIPLTLTSTGTDVDISIDSVTGNNIPIVHESQGIFQLPQVIWLGPLTSRNIRRMIPNRHATRLLI